MPVSKSLLILSKFLWTLTVFFIRNETWISLPRPSIAIACSMHSVDLRCLGAGCRTPAVTVSGNLCSTSITLRILPCDLDLRTEYITLLINGASRYMCNPIGSKFRNSQTWYTCIRNLNLFSKTNFTAELKGSGQVNSRCYNSVEGLGSYFVYGRIYFTAKYYSVNAPTRRLTRSPTVTPTTDPTLLPTTNPTNLPTPLSCFNNWKWCDYAEKNGLCYDEDNETRVLVTSECPVSCGTCYNSTLGPTSVPTSLPTLRPTSPTMSPSRKPSRNPTPTASPTCTDKIQFCDVIETFCNSSNLETRLKMATDCAATCGSCTLKPTAIPTFVPSDACVDSYAYCSALTQRGACYDENLSARFHFQNKCPVSCGTCNNRTVSPTMLPSPSPTISPTTPTSAPSRSPSERPSLYPTSIPTASPTCVDTITYCNSIQSYCKSSDPDTLAKMQTDCAATCGFCTLQPSRQPTTDPTDIPTRLPSTAPVQPSAIPTKFPTKRPSTSPTNSPSSSPSLVPSATNMPSKSPTPCEDLFFLCNELALTGACYDDDRNTRNEIHKDCPISCGTCYNNTVSPTASPTILPSPRPSKQPSQYPSLVPTSEPTCADLVGYCRKITQYCSTSDSKKALVMKKQCSKTCGFCRRTRRKNKKRRTKRRKKGKRRKKRKRRRTLRPALNSKSSSFVVPSQPPSTQPVSARGRARDRRRTAMDSFSSVGRKSLTHGTQIQVQAQLRSFNFLWIGSLICLTLASLLAVIWKCIFLYIKRKSKNQGEFVTLHTDDMVHEPQERSCISKIEVNDRKVEQQVIDG
jgi:hypothetical protein